MICMRYTRPSKWETGDAEAFGATGSQLGDVLSTRTGTTARLLARAARLQTLSEAVQGIDAPWSAQLRVGNIRGGTAVLFAENAGAASRAKLHAERIAEKLRKAGAPCERLVIKTRPSRRQA